MTPLQLWGWHFSSSGSIFSSVQRFCRDMIVLVSGEGLCGFLRRAETLSAQPQEGSEGTFCVLHKLLQNVGMQNWKTVPGLLRDVYFKDMFCITMFLLCWWNRCFCRAKMSIKFCWSCLRRYSPANCPVPILEQAYSRAAGRWCMYLRTLLQKLVFQCKQLIKLIARPWPMSASFKSKSALRQWPLQVGWCLLNFWVCLHSGHSRDLVMLTHGLSHLVCLAKLVVEKNNHTGTDCSSFCFFFWGKDWKI